MRVRVLPAAAVAWAAARAIGRRIAARPGLVLGLATGATMVPVYAALVALHRRGQVSFARVTTFNLDEYVGLGPAHPASYRATMRRLLFDHVDVAPARTFLPDGLAPDPAAEAARYERAIRAAGGLDLLLLGLGRNGHIGFNEPPADFASHTHVARLRPATLRANRGFFAAGEAVPARAITMGIRTILAARATLLVATGHEKRRAVRAALAGPLTPACPASVLRRHRACTVLVDRAAV